MNHTQRVVTGALATLAALVWAMPAKSQESQPISEIDHYSATRLIELGVKPGLAYTVEATGVPVLDGATITVDNPCRSDGEFVFYGLYEFDLNLIIMCSNNIQGHELFTEVFTHEAAHLMQDCRAGIHNKILHAGPETYVNGLWRTLDESDQLNIIENYPEEFWDAETEAYALEQYPERVERGLQRFCFH